MKKIPTSPKSLLKMSIKELLKMSDNFFEHLGSQEDTEKLYRKLARASDKRLREIEKLSQQEEYQNMKEFAYKRAMADIKSWSGDKATRFNTKPPVRESEMYDKIMDMKSFLKAPSSSAAGIESSYAKSAATLNEKYGTDFTWQDMATFFESRFFQKTEREYDSKQIVKAIGVMQNDPEKFRQIIKESRSKDINVEDYIDIKDKVLAETVNDLIDQYGNALERYLKTR